MRVTGAACAAAAQLQCGEPSRSIVIQVDASGLTDGAVGAGAVWAGVPRPASTTADIREVRCPPITWRRRTRIPSVRAHASTADTNAAITASSAEPTGSLTTTTVPCGVGESGRCDTRVNQMSALKFAIDVEQDCAQSCPSQSKAEPKVKSGAGRAENRSTFAGEAFMVIPTCGGHRRVQRERGCSYRSAADSCLNLDWLIVSANRTLHLWILNRSPGSTCFGQRGSRQHRRPAVTWLNADLPPAAMTTGADARATTSPRFATAAA